MKKTALATQIPESLKKEVNSFCSERGFTISHLITEALREKIDTLREEDKLFQMALERMSEPGELSYREYKNRLALLNK